VGSDKVGRAAVSRFWFGDKTNSTGGDGDTQKNPRPSFSQIEKIVKIEFADRTP